MVTFLRRHAIMMRLLVWAITFYPSLPAAVFLFLGDPVLAVAVAGLGVAAGLVAAFLLREDLETGVFVGFLFAVPLLGACALHHLGAPLWLAVAFGALATGNLLVILVLAAGSSDEPADD